MTRQELEAHLEEWREEVVSAYDFIVNDWGGDFTIADTETMRADANTIISAAFAGKQKGKREKW